MSVIENAVSNIRDWEGKSVSIEPLSGGLTNSNFKVTVDGIPHFVRVPGESTELLAVDRKNEHFNSKAAAEAAALVAMVARLTVGKSKYKDVEPDMWKLIERADGLRASLQRAVEEDAVAFEQVMAAYKLPKQTPQQIEERTAVIQETILEAAKVPLETSRMALAVMQLAETACKLGNLNAITDAASAAQLASAAFTSAAANVSINISTLAAQDARMQFEHELLAFKTEKEAILTRVAHIVVERAQITLL